MATAIRPRGAAGIGGSRLRLRGVRMDVATTDYHTAGEPFRIVVDGGPEIAGDSVPARRETARASPEIDRVRQLLCNEPRGHADMYGCFLVRPTTTAPTSASCSGTRTATALRPRHDRARRLGRGVAACAPRATHRVT